MTLMEWQRHDHHGLRLRIHLPDITGMVRTVPIPGHIESGLTGPGGVGLTHDPARDLLRLEHHTRHLVSQLAGTAAAFDQALTEYRAPGAAADSARRWPWRRRGNGAEETTYANERDTAARTVRAGDTQITLLRQFIGDLDVLDGPLVRAREGWARPTGPPAHVTVYPDEASFIDERPGRATDTTWGGRTLAADPAGTGWRHDPDDLLDADPEQSGTWTLNHLPSTGEVYAHRHHPHLPTEIWLLAADLDDTVRWLVAGLRSNATDPNSLHLAANVLHTQRVIT
jgi:hypothetical protein